MFWQLLFVQLWICTKNWWENSAKKFINSLKLSSLFSFLNKVLKTTIFALTAIVYLRVLVLRMNKHEGWIVLIYEIEIKNICCLRSSKWKGCQCLDRALSNIHISISITTCKIKSPFKKDFISVWKYNSQNEVGDDNRSLRENGF